MLTLECLVCLTFVCISLVVAIYSTLCLIAAADFSAVTDMLPFTSGISSLPCEIPLTEDPIIENDETFQLSLSVNAAQGSLSTTAANPSIATATIIDDGKGSNSESRVSTEPLLSCTIELHYTCECSSKL